MEHVGFDVGNTPEGKAALATAAAQISPALARARTVDQWSGLRPMTPDFLPILGRDPDFPTLVYACGHSRNGILLGPLTGECVAALACDEAPALDITPFSISRFASAE
jgi:glycine/D-amino acid oxidase-like deaminating enzyme